LDPTARLLSKSSGNESIFEVVNSTTYQYKEHIYSALLGPWSSTTLGVTGVALMIMGVYCLKDHDMIEKIIKFVSGEDFKEKFHRLNTSYSDNSVDKEKAERLQECTLEVSKFHQDWLESKVQQKDKTDSASLGYSCQNAFKALQKEKIPYNYGLLASLNGSEDAELVIINEMKRVLKLKMDELEYDIEIPDNSLIEIEEMSS
jgi:hypothetical protein